MSTGDAKRGEASSRTSREHGEIAQAVMVMERALAAPAPGREEAWKRRVLAAVQEVRERVAHHSRSAEGPGGIMDEIEVTMGRSWEITVARREHESLRAQAEELAQLLEHPEDGPTCAEVRERAARLTSGLRAHQAREADLILLAFEQDIGAGD